MPTRRILASVQYFEMLGSRSIVADGWKATTDHVSKGVMDEEELLEGSRVFADDTWSLFRLADDFSEAHDLAAEHPDVLRELQELWTAEAERNQVFPIVDELIGRFAAIIPPPNAPGERVVYRREGGLVPDESVRAASSAGSASPPTSTSPTATSKASSARSATGPAVARSSSATAGSSSR